MEEALIDTNILIYAWDNNLGAKQEIARKLIAQCWEKKRYFFISTQNLAEFIYASKKIKNLNKEEIKQIVNDILNWPFWKIISYNSETLKRAIMQRDNIYDSLILETAIENNVKVIYSEDTRGFKSDKIKIINPFETKSLNNLYSAKKHGSNKTK